MTDLRNFQVTKAQAKELLHTLSIHHYVQSLGFTPYEWQSTILKSQHKRKVINGARQSGKSTIISSKPCHIAKYFPGSVSLIVAATEFQAFLDMEKVKAYMSHDPQYPKIERSSDRLITLANGSWIMVVPATEKAARGPSAPRLIILDEASRIEDIVYTSGVIPMLTENPECELILISTPNGKQGFFYKAFNSKSWERYEVSSPWEVIDMDFSLKPGMAEEEYQARLAKLGVIGYRSPRHMDRAEQQFNLEEMGTQMYRQEYGVQFVEPEDQVFGYDEIERLFSSTAEPFELDKIGVAEPLLL